MNILPVERARALLETLTPLKSDCGRVCGGACCEGSAEDGMLLFPGEARLASRTGFLHVSRISPSDCGPSLGFAECRRSCIRHSRPLSCRIFPLLPYVAKDDRKLSAPFRFSIIQDPRGKYLCPLIYAGDHVEEEFRERVAMAISEAGKCRTVRKFIFRLSEIADEYRRFTCD